MPSFTGSYGRLGSSAGHKFTGSYGRSGSSPTHKFTGSYGRTSGSKKKGGHSLGGFLGNVAGGIESAATGIVPGLVATGKAIGQDVAYDVKHPLGHGGTRPRHIAKLGKAIGQSYADYYGPLAHGDFDTFLDNLYEDPVSVALDAATVASLGLGAGVKVGILPAKGGRVLELTTASGTKVSKPLAKGELRAQLQALGARAGEKLDETMGRPGVRAAKQQAKNLSRAHANVRAKATDFDRAVVKIRGNAGKVATFLRGRFDRQALDAEVRRLTAQAAKDGPNSPAAKTLRVITKPKVQQLFDRPTARMVKAHEEAAKLGSEQSRILGVKPEAAEASRYRPAQIAHGATYNEGAGAFTGGPTVEDLKARGLEPVYYPDTSKRPGGVAAAGRGGGKGIPARTPNMRQNRGVLQMAGQLILDPSTLNESFLRSAKYQHYSDTHAALVDMARPSDTIPQGWEMIRKKRSDRVSGKDRSRSDFEEWVDSHLDAEGEWKSKDSGLTTDSPDDAVRDADGKYLIVPSKVVRTMAGEFTRQNQLLYLMNRYPLKVWRAMVLGLRPAYLVNNVLGNTLMYLVHSGKPSDLRELTGAFKQFVKPSQGEQIDRLLQEHFAGQTHGGFVATQMPQFRATGRARKAAAATVRAIPSLDRRWEQALRRAKVKAELRKHPALKAQAKKMGQETSYFEKIAPVLDENPDIVTQVYDRVDDALGSYDTMSAVEKNVLRNLFPFYAWYKAIVTVTGKLTIEQPLKVNLLTQLGQIAVEQNLDKAGFNRDEIPTSLLGFIPTRQEGNRVRGFNTSGVNPYETVGQVAEFLGAPTAGPGWLAKAPGLNPLLADILASGTGRTTQGYGTDNVIPGISTIESVPFARLYGAAENKYGLPALPGLPAAPTGDTYNDRDFVDELLRYLGVPYARVSPSAAKRVADR